MLTTLIADVIAIGLIGFIMSPLIVIVYLWNKM